MFGFFFSFSIPSQHPGFAYRQICVRFNVWSCICQLNRSSSRYFAKVKVPCVFSAPCGACDCEGSWALAVCWSRGMWVCLAGLFHFDWTASCRCRCQWRLLSSPCAESLLNIHPLKSPRIDCFSESVFRLLGLWAGMRTSGPFQLMANITSKCWKVWTLVESVFLSWEQGCSLFMSEELQL